jgi:hypothetical protein
VCPPVAHTISNRMMDLAPTILQVHIDINVIRKRRGFGLLFKD